MKKRLLFASLLVMTTGFSYGQQWKQQKAKNTVNSTTKKKLNLKALEQQLSSNQSQRGSKLTVSIPNEKGENESFILTERDLLSPKLKDKFQSIKSFHGYSKANPLKKISLGFSKAKGINAIVYDENDKYIIEKKQSEYYLINSNELPSLKNFSCGQNYLSNKTANKNNPTTNKQLNNTPLYRKYKLAIATDYSYNAYFAEEGQEPTLEDSFAAVNQTMTYVLPIYENELSISFELVDNTNITFLTEESNPYNGMYDQDDVDEFILNRENQRQLDEKIGSESYDIGVLLTNSEKGGSAGDIGTVCGPHKGATFIGYSEDFIPEGIEFAIIAAHEMGHQFGANHTHGGFEGSGANRETGSGVTLMGYAGIAKGHDVVRHPYSQFHNYSISQINNYLATTSCGTSTPNLNIPPEANAGLDYTIPKGTAFKLTGTTGDAENENFTYSWEQNDQIIVEDLNELFSSPRRDKTGEPNFRIYKHNSSPTQYFPPLENVLNNQLYSTWNMIPDVARDLNFVFSVRDNKPGGGQVISDYNLIKTTNDGPFKITNITLNQSFKVAESISIEWDVAGTNSGEINTQNVRIKLTTDNGNTFTTLVESTPNNGNTTVNLPTDLKAEKANIIIEAIDNIYFASSPYIAIGYEVSLSCNVYSKDEPFVISETGTESTITISNVSKPIEDISLLIDAESSNIIASFMKSGVDANFQKVWDTNCHDSTLNYKFNRYGDSIFENCDNSGATITGSTTDFSVYESENSNGDYIFKFDYDNEDLPPEEIEEVTVNKFGVELCHREASTLAVSDITKQRDLFVYPNPTNGLFNIRMDTKTNKIKADIINMVGQVVMTKQFNLASKKIDQAIHANNLPKGVYMIKITDGDQIQTKKLIIR